MSYSKVHPSSIKTRDQSRGFRSYLSRDQVIHQHTNRPTTPFDYLEPKLSFLGVSWSFEDHRRAQLELGRRWFGKSPFKVGKRNGLPYSGITDEERREFRSGLKWWESTSISFFERPF